MTDDGLVPYDTGWLILDHLQSGPIWWCACVWYDGRILEYTCTSRMEVSCETTWPGSVDDALAVVTELLKDRLNANWRITL